MSIAPVEQRPSGETLYNTLERDNWAPWLRFDVNQLDQQARVFPEGQIVLSDSGEPDIMLAANRVNWDGQRTTLPSWDDVAGTQYTFEDAYMPNGNTFVLMSMSARKEAKGSGLSQRIFEQVRSVADSQGMEHIIGDFRPSGFGAYKAETGDLNFMKYIAGTREDGLPQDPWLRAVKRQGAEFLQVDRRAMVINANVAQVEGWSQEYKPEAWQEVTDPEQTAYLLDWHEPLHDLEQVDQILECGETGTWYMDRKNDKAVYIESNVWGEVPVVTPSRTTAPERSVDDSVDNYRYNLSAEEVAAVEAEFVDAVKSRNPAPDVYAAWVAPDHRFSNAIRTMEAKHFPEIPNIVDDQTEKESLFYVLVDTRDGSDRIVHGARLSGLSIDSQQESAYINKDKPGFVVIEELMRNGQITDEEFKGYCEQSGIEATDSFSVETNFRVGKRSPSRNGVRITDIAYMTFNRILGESGSTEHGRVFASINTASRISFASAGINFSEIPVRPGKEGDQKYDLVSLPYAEALQRLAVSLGSLAAVQETKFVA